MTVDYIKKNKLIDDKQAVLVKLKSGEIVFNNTWQKLEPSAYLGEWIMSASVIKISTYIVAGCFVPPIIVLEVA